MPLLLLGVLVILVCLSFIPTTTVMGYEIKSVDILSDLKGEAPEAFLVEDLKLVPEEKQTAPFQCPEGVTCIEDYGAGTPSGMSSFYKALEQKNGLNRPVRIAYFGDSFVEGDILTDELREMLQEKFGGCGVGYLSVAPEAPGFRKSVKQFSSGWDAHQAIDTTGFVSRKQSIAQTYAHPLGRAYTEITAVDKFKHAAQFETTTFYLSSAQPLTLSVTLNDSVKQKVQSEGTGKVEALRVDGNMNRVRWTLSGNQNVNAQGVAVEGKKGITLDNFALRATSGTHLQTLSADYLKQLAQVRPYDLIILHYGLNVASKNQLNYEYYVTSMSKVVSRLKECFPTTSILIVGVGDRETRIKGELHTMKGVLALMQYQQQLAALNEVAFWNLYEAMGGDGSIVKLSETKPAQARKDYTHITHEGGHTLATYFYDALMAGYDKHLSEQ